MKVTVKLNQTSQNVLTEIAKQHPRLKICCESIVAMEGSHRIKDRILSAAKIKVNTQTGEIINCKPGSYTFTIVDENRRLA